MKKQRFSRKLALVISAILSLLTAFLTRIIGGMINVPIRMEWLPIVALIVVFVASLYVTLRLADDGGRTSAIVDRPKNISMEKIELNNSKLRNISADGTVTFKDIKATDSEISDIEAR